MKEKPYVPGYAEINAVWKFSNFDHSTFDRKTPLSLLWFSSEGFSLWKTEVLIIVLTGDVLMPGLFSPADRCHQLDD